MHRVRHLTGLVALGLILLAPAAAAQAAAPKFAYINSQVILQRAPGSDQVQAAITKERETALASVQKLQDSLKTAFDAFQQRQATLSPEQRAQQEQQFRQKQVEFDQRVGQMEQQVAQRQYELLKPMMDQIRSVLDAIREEEGYAFIFDVASESNLIVAADRKLDITERVIARLKPVSANTARPDSASSPAGAKPGPAGVRPPGRPPTR